MIKYFVATEEMSNKAGRNMTVSTSTAVGIFIFQILQIFTRNLYVKENLFIVFFALQFIILLALDLGLFYSFEV